MARFLTRTDFAALVSETYGYDAADRLTKVTRSGSGAVSASYTLDAADNLTAITAGTASWSAAVNDNNQITTAGGSAWSHDAAGNLRDDGTRSYAWDAENRLISVSDRATGRTSSFRYDALSRRVAITDDGVETWYLWCGDRICAASDSAGTVTARYAPQGETAPAGALYYHRDHLGSVIRTVDAAGTVQGTTRYGAYGTSDATSGVQPSFGYAGMFRHSASGLYLTHYRAYDPASGRWLSRDPIGEIGGINLYAYVGGDPINWVDPDGRLFFLAAAALTGTGYTAVAAAADAALIGAAGWWAQQQILNSKTPNTGEPGSVHENPGSGQIRKYGPDGKPEWDIDSDHDHGQNGEGDAHGHNWENGKRPEGEGYPICKIPPCNCKP